MTRSFLSLILATVTATIVVTFQACTPQKSGTPANTNSQSAERTTSAQNDALPFHGKTLGVYQKIDEAFCKKAYSTQNVRQEIVRNNAGTWLTVDNCQSILARDIGALVSNASDPSKLIFKNQQLQFNAKKDAFEHARIVCRNKTYPNHHVVMVYESADGLVLDQPYYRATDPDFLPVTAIRYQEEGIHEQSGLHYDTVYRSTFIQSDGTVGSFKLMLDYQPSGQILANWYVKYADKFRGNSGECKAEPSRYPW